MAVNPSTFGPCPQFENTAGQPSVGDKLFFYTAGTTTKLNTYTNSTGSVANTNPIVLNALGQPSTEIWFTNGSAYKMVWAPSTDTDPPTNPIRTFDNLRGINDTTASAAANEWVLSASTPTYVSATSFTVTGNQTTTFTVGRRLKTTNTSGTIYSTISASVYTTSTTITVINDSGVIDSGLSDVSYGILTSVNPSLPNSAAVRSAMGVMALDSSNIVATAIGGTADAITATFSPNVTTLTNGLKVRLTGLSPNGTTTPTLAAGTTAATTIKNPDGTAIGIGQIMPASDFIYSTAFAAWILDTVRQSRQIQTIPTPTFNAGAMTIPAAAYSLDFRSATLGDGTVTTVSATASALVVPSGATLGLTSGVASELDLLALFPSAGVIEYAVVNLAGGVDLTETGLVSTTAISATATSASVVYSTTARTNVPYRVLGAYRSTQTTAGTWAQAMSLIQGNGGMAIKAIPFSSLIRLNTVNGYGSTNTGVRRWTNVVVNQGTDITYTDSATLGATFTINTSGTYGIEYTDNFIAATDFAITINASVLTSLPTNLPEFLCETTATGANQRFTANWSGFLAQGSVIRAQSTGSAVGTGRSFFSVGRLG